LKGTLVHDPEFAIRPFQKEDYDLVLSLWRSSPGLSLSEADSRTNLERYLVRNPGLSLTAWHRDRLVGAILCGHDGRRGFLHHVAVAPGYRRQGVASCLIEGCLSALSRDGIRRCHVFVLTDNNEGRAFWRKMKWKDRNDIALMTRQIEK